MKNISVIVPVLNAERYIDACIESLINQNYPRNNFEIIIVDNGSSDDTAKMIKKYNGNIKLFNESKRGAYAARNTGIKHSHGEIIAFTDIDCIADENWLRELSKGFETKNIGCVVGSVKSFPGKSIVEIYSKNKDILSQKTTIDSKFLPYGVTANASFRRDVFTKIGSFDEEFISGGDADISWRMQLNTDYKLIYIPESIVQHRHRTTLKNLFVQHFKYGVGSASLYYKYGRLMNYDIKRSISDWLKSAKAEFSTSFKNLIKNDGSYYMAEALLSFICMVGYRAGRLYGGLKLRLFYI